jgi:hypothetical protein
MQRSVRNLVVAAVLILVSGAFMVWAGYQFADGHIAIGLWITTPPGFTIQPAFFLIRRVDRAAGFAAPSLAWRLGQEATILLAGGVMVLAGFAGADWNWIIGSVIILLGLPTIGLAVWLGRRSVADPNPTPIGTFRT